MLSNHNKMFFTFPNALNKIKFDINIVKCVFVGGKFVDMNIKGG